MLILKFTPRAQDAKLFLIDFGAVKQITTQVVLRTKFTVAIGTLDMY